MGELSQKVRLCYISCISVDDTDGIDPFLQKPQGFPQGTLKKLISHYRRWVSHSETDINTGSQKGGVCLLKEKITTGVGG